MHNPSAPVIFISQKAFLWASFLLIKMPLLYTIARKNEVEELYTGHSFYIPLTHVLLPSYSTFVFPVKMEYEWNSTIFGLKVIFLPLFLWSDLFRVSLQILHFVPLCSWWKKISIVQSVCQEDFPLQRIFWQQCDNCFIEQIRIYLCTYSLVILVRTSFSKLVFESFTTWLTYLKLRRK